MTPDEYCQDKAAKSGSSFYYSFLFLPPERRRIALYAFCREVDDVVDECTDPRWPASSWPGGADRPDVRRQARAPGDARAAAPAELFDHARAAAGGGRRHGNGPGPDPLPGLAGPAQTAGTPPAWWSELSAGVFGYSDPRTLVYARKLGLAFQMTNIIRDVGDDARRGRIYPGQRHAAVRGQGLGHPQWRILRALLGADEVPGRPRPRGCTARPCAACPRPTGAQRRAMMAIYRAARRDRARQLAGAAPAHFADAPAQALAGLENLGGRRPRAGPGWCGEGRGHRRGLGRPWPPPWRCARPRQGHCLRSRPRPADARGASSTANSTRRWTAASTCCPAPTATRWR